MEGFLQAKIPVGSAADHPRPGADAGAGRRHLAGEGAVGKLLVLSQVVLSLQLPFALWPLIRFTSDRRLMGPFANSRLVASIAWSLFGLISWPT